MNILVIQNRMGIGDMVIFLPFIEAIAKKYKVKIYEIEMPNNLKGQYQEFTKANLDKLNKHLNIEWVNILDYIKKDYNE